MTDNRVLRQLLYGELLQDSRKERRPKLRYKDILKSNFKWSRISSRRLDDSAANRLSWMILTTRAAAGFEEDVSMLPEKDVTGQRLLQSSQQTFLGTCVLLALNCGVTFAPISENADLVIIGYWWTTNRERDILPTCAI
uniref:Uncharacterized protein n=1 Tax=Octopus bimaculoides TaxID=37653 RepID=A0A0L8IHE6_OCTBM